VAAVLAGLALPVVAGQVDASSRAETLAARSACAVRPNAYSYNWPVKPFRRPHPVRGNFGDPRTLFVDATTGTFSFHNGVDIVADDGAAVYPVVSGVVVFAGKGEIIVETRDGRRFQYWHLMRAVALQTGEWVVRDRTVLGYVRAPYHHVHLTEIRDGIAQNPLAPGHLVPYRDRTPPTVGAIHLVQPGGGSVDPQALAGDVEIVAEASDLPSLPVPGSWYGFPVSPAALSWRLTSGSGQDVVPEQVAIDFRSSEPEDDAFWHVYVHGTYQNFPRVGRRYLFRQAGKYLFDLTPDPLDTTKLPAGSYVLTVTATDVCGNTGSLSQPVFVLPRPEASPPPPTPPPTTSSTPATPAPPASTASTEQPSHRPAPLPTTPPATQPVAPKPAPASVAWPARRAGYTVALASLPSSGGPAEAKAMASEARSQGLREVGYLLSNRYTSLRPGYWVVFSGVFRTRTQADEAASRIAPLRPGVVVRPVVPNVRLIRWPGKRARYTLVLASLPTSVGLRAARTQAREAAAGGLRRVGVLVSAHFRSLQPGYYVVFCGTYRSSANAQRALEHVARIFPSAYPRAVSR